MTTPAANRSHVLSEEEYAGIDPGIRFAVRVLNANGIETCQSCQGGEGHAYDRPTVDLPGGGSRSAAGFQALDCLYAYGLTVYDVSRVWAVSDGLPFEVVWRITFRHTFEDRANERPIFEWHYEAVS